MWFLVRRCALILCLVLGVNFSAVAISNDGNQFWAAALSGFLLGTFVTFMDPKGP